MIWFGFIQESWHYLLAPVQDFHASLGLAGSSTTNIPTGTSDPQIYMREIVGVGVGELGFPHTAEDPPRNEVADLLSVSRGVDRHCVYREGSLLLARAVDEALQTPTFLWCGV